MALSVYLEQPLPYASLQFYYFHLVDVEPLFNRLLTF